MLFENRPYFQHDSAEYGCGNESQTESNQSFSTACDRFRKTLQQHQVTQHEPQASRLEHGGQAETMYVSYLNRRRCCLFQIRGEAC